MPRARSAQAQAVIAQEPPCGSRRGMVGILLIFGLTVLKRHCVSRLRSWILLPKKN